MINGIGKMIGGGIGSIFGPIGTAVGSTIGGYTSDIVDGIGSAFESIGDFFGGLFANGGLLPAGKWGIAGEAGMELVKQANGLMKVVGLNGPEVITGPAEIISNKDLMRMGAANGNNFAGMFANGTTGGIGSVPNNIVQMNNASNFIPQQQQAQQTSVTYNINAVDAKSFKQMIAADPSFIYAVTMQGSKGVKRL
jgi:Flp pilus assembly pilin Flp